MGAVWLSIISSAPGQQGAADGALANALTRTRNAAPSQVIPDPRGGIGRLYAPHMFMVGKNGTLGCIGGADSIASARAGDIVQAQPCTRKALLAVTARRAAPNPVTPAYGCWVKYAAEAGAAINLALILPPHSTILGYKLLSILHSNHQG